ncbi:hypothetical protein G6F57_005042 [Rhizopus arrhizus]|uniref:Uncharacterized protein n=1 Tax=Rhizopus oryzae TaxID=64495 RepID=A0A9P7BTQ7_RHIOR|nr:hypothetical protein G6F23_005765 [Rhizopus arrhizus]KAG1417652.1 hypothetical protein G6F58_005411 [Rhizopus delemar]KAG0764088.1 hypothetical protein G6F24_005504 [Rhizopus arrhizus]KAG0794746.1 hypothetical protein G6F21_002629 [Rhizopus arrhizus]KAG0798455.1 hypothetical protein G6F22_004205 [Rhizopus arrhizus]
MDNYAITDQCQPTASSIQDAPPCADILINYAKSAFRKAYLVVFAALALEVLAMTNAITLLCTSFDAEDENERRKHRKSGIRLDEMSLESPTTLVGSSYTLPEEQKKHYADSPIGDSYSSYSAHDVNSPIHDSNRYEVYNHQNDSNIYHQDNHGYNTGSRVNAYY